MSTASGSPLPTAFNPTTCLRRGLCSVPTSKQDQRPSALNNTHPIYYEQHGAPGPGSDPITGTKHKIVFIMGLNTSCFSWGPQVRYFGGLGSDFTALVFDNRGVGNSGYPRGPYKTSGMAEDIISLLDNLGWTGEREINVVGLSLGGMIAQELAYRIPHRICSLVLAVTNPGGWTLDSFTPWRGIRGLTQLTFIADPLKKVSIALDLIFPKRWLDERAEFDPHAEQNGNTEDNKMGKTNYDVEKKSLLFRISLVKPQRPMGSFSQMAAAITHYVSPERLAYIAANIPKIVIVTGDDDNLVNPYGSERIKAGMDLALDMSDEEDRSRVECLKWEGVGHGIHFQKAKEFNELVERCPKEGREMLEKGWKGRNV